MTWGNVAGAAIGVVGGYLNSKNQPNVPNSGDSIKAQERANQRQQERQIAMDRPTIVTPTGKQEWNPNRNRMDVTLNHQDQRYLDNIRDFNQTNLNYANRLGQDQWRGEEDRLNQMDKVRDQSWQNYNQGSTDYSQGLGYRDDVRDMYQRNMGTQEGLWKQGAGLQKGYGNYLGGRIDAAGKNAGLGDQAYRQQIQTELASGRITRDMLNAQGDLLPQYQNLLGRSMDQTGKAMDTWNRQNAAERDSIGYLRDKIQRGEALSPEEDKLYRGRMALESSGQGAQTDFYNFQSDMLPDFQKAMGGAFGNITKQLGSIGKGMPTLGIPGLAAFDENYGQRLGDSLYESAANRLRPENARAEADFTTRLRQQGLQPGTEAFDRAMKNLLTSQGDVLSQAALDAQTKGWQEARARYDQTLQAQNQQANQAIQGYGAQLQGYMAPIEQLSGLSGALGNFSQLLTPQDYRSGPAPGADQSLLTRAGGNPMGGSMEGFMQDRGQRAGAAPVADQSLKVSAGGLPSYQAGLAGGTPGAPGAITGGQWNPNIAPAATTPSFPQFSTTQGWTGGGPNYMTAAQNDYQNQMGQWQGQSQQIGDFASSIPDLIGLFGNGGGGGTDQYGVPNRNWNF